MSTAKDIAYLGPEGTYAHEMALKRYRGKRVTFTPCSSIEAVFEYAAQAPHRRGVVPIVNSSGGTIYDTIDGLMKGLFSGLGIVARHQYAQTETAGSNLIGETAKRRLRESSF